MFEWIINKDIEYKNIEVNALRVKNSHKMRMKQLFWWNKEQITVQGMAPNNWSIPKLNNWSIPKLKWNHYKQVRMHESRQWILIYFSCRNPN